MDTRPRAAGSCSFFETWGSTAGLRSENFLTRLPTRRNAGRSPLL